MNRMISASLLVMTLAAGFSTFVMFWLRPTSTGFLAFSLLWLNLPYLGMAAALWVMRRRGVMVWYGPLISMWVSVGGVLLLADVVFWHPDAQGGIAVMMTPISQGLAAAVLVLLLGGWTRWRQGRK